ncbi:unnamed protein product [Amoebophrya sp. A120]|nr:unnamed protein product [Amoebophrya sp. A120]|eukprot:GSA120T00019697001.1
MKRDVTQHDGLRVTLKHLNKMDPLLVDGPARKATPGILTDMPQEMKYSGPGGLGFTSTEDVVALAIAKRTTDVYPQNKEGFRQASANCQGFYNETEVGPQFLAECVDATRPQAFLLQPSSMTLAELNARKPADSPHAPEMSTQQRLNRIRMKFPDGSLKPLDEAAVCDG